MIWLIAKKDFLLNILSVRFVIGFVLCLVIIPFTMIVSVDDYSNKVRIYQVDKQAAEEELNDVKVYSFLRPVIVMEPKPLSTFSKGIEPNIGNQVKIRLGAQSLFPEGHTSTRDNPLLNGFMTIDFSTVIAIAISLLALVFAYDSITRERENGTMKLVLTGQISRVSFIMGKFLGLLVTLLPILVFCFLLGGLILLFDKGVHFGSYEWSGITMLFVASIIYMIVFILLGMFISAKTSYSSSSIIICLMCWIVFLFLIPNIATQVSKSMVSTSILDKVDFQALNSEDALELTRDEYEKQVTADLGMKGISFYNYMSLNDGEVEMFGGSWEVSQYVKRMSEFDAPVTIRAGDRAWNMWNQIRLDNYTRQQRVRQYISWLSPSELFTQSADIICNTDPDALLDQMAELREYRQTLIQYFHDKNAFSSYRWFTAQPEETFQTEADIEENDFVHHDRSMYERLNRDDMPLFVAAAPDRASIMAAASGRLGALLAIAVALLIGTIMVFMKYDVR